MKIASETLRSPEKLRSFARILCWVGLAVIVFATLSPLSLRPRLPLVGPGVERFGALFLMMLVFGYAYPRQRWAIFLAGILLILGLEGIQTLESSRHGRLLDALVKAAGALVGTLASVLADRFLAPSATGLHVKER